MAEHDLKITIGPKPSLLFYMVRPFVLLAFILTIPAANNLLLGGGWALDLIGAIMGLLIAVVLLKQIADFDKIKTFATSQEAADWVASEDWRGAK